MEKDKYVVQTWMGRNIGEFDTLCEADDFKLEICGYDEGMMEDIYIIGIDSNGNEFAPEW